MAEEHLHCLCIIFDQLREHNLKLKPSKFDFFRNEITYLAHQVSKDRVHPSNLNLKAITECAQPQTYTEVHAFLSLAGHYRRFIKGFSISYSPWVSILPERVRVGITHWGCHEGLWGIETGVHDSSCLGVCWLHQTFPDGDWCIQDGFGEVLSQKQADRQYHPTAYGSRALTPHKKSYHSTKLEFLALKWAVTGALQRVPALPVIGGADW